MSMRRGPPQAGDNTEPLLQNATFTSSAANNLSFARSSDVEMKPKAVSPRASRASKPAAPAPQEEVKYTLSQKRLLRELEQLMKEKMTTDVFALFAAVLRKRAGVINMKEHEQGNWDTLLRKKDLHIVVHSCFGLFMSIITTTLFWEFGGAQHTTLPEVTDNQLMLLYCTQVGMTLSTLMCIGLIVQKYTVLLLMSKRMEWASTSMYDLIQSEKDADAQDRYKSSYHFTRSSLRWKLFFEVFIHSLHPLIWMNTDETKQLYEAFQIIIFARLYLVVNVIFKFSAPFKRRREIRSSNQELQRTGFQPSVGGTLKMIFYDHPARSTMLVLLCTLTILGFIVFVTERSVESDDNQFRRLQNALWFGFVTFSTVGYGDMAPVTGFGRLASIAIGAVGISTTTVFGGVVTNLMVQSREQRAVSQYLRETNADALVADSAARVIQNAFRYSRSKTKDIVNPWIKGGHKSNVVYGAIKAFKTHRWHKSQTQSSTNDPVTDSKINNVNAYLNSARRSIETSRSTASCTRDAVRSFVSEMQAILEVRKDAGGGAAPQQSPRRKSAAPLSPRAKPASRPTRDSVVEL